MMEILCRLDNGGVSIKPRGLIEQPLPLPLPLPFPLPPLKNKPVVRNLEVKLLKNGVQMLTVTASPGFENITLAVNFFHDKQVRDMFQTKILFVEVSMSPDWTLILKCISESLSGIEWSDLQNDEHAFSFLALWQKLTCQKPISIVLDVVWDEPESEYLLDKLSQMPFCKILVTSTSFPRSSQSCSLELLEVEEETLEPFHCRASLENASCYDYKLHEGTGRLLSRRPASYWKDEERTFCTSESQNEEYNQSCNQINPDVGADCSSPHDLPSLSVSILDEYSSSFFKPKSKTNKSPFRFFGDGFLPLRPQLGASFTEASPSLSTVLISFM